MGDRRYRQVVVVAATGGRQRVVAAAALLAIPPIWLLQCQGELVPQFGGRCLLVSGALLTVAASVARRGVDFLGFRLNLVRYRVGPAG